VKMVDYHLTASARKNVKVRCENGVDLKASARKIVKVRCENG
jgi:hypothetical protein